MRRKRCLAMLLVSLISAMAFAQTDETLSDSIYSADIPIVYGEQGFIQRIERRAGEREPIGLVLSGGSARALAHIGVLQYLEEQQIIPDFIVSNSMGSIVGLLYGAGLSPDQIYQLISNTNIGALFSLTLPTAGGVLDVSQFSDLLHEYLGDLDLEELPVPVMVLCEDLKSKQQIRIASGDFYTVLEASFALPFYFPPVPFEGHLLTDGGITNLLHLDAAYEYTDSVIVSSAFYDNPDLDLTNPITILNTSIDIGKRREGISDLKEFEPILIRTATESFSFMDFANTGELYEAGYRSAQLAEPMLARVPGSKVSAGQMERRLSFDESSPAISEAVDTFGFIPSRVPRLQLSVTITPQFTPFDPMPLSDQFLAAMSLDLHTSNSTSLIYLGAGIKPGAETGIYPVLGLSHSWYPLSSIESISEMSLSFVNDSLSFQEFDIGTVIAAGLARKDRWRMTADAAAMLRIDAAEDFIYNRFSAGITTEILLPEETSQELYTGIRWEDLSSFAADAAMHAFIPLGDTPLHADLDARMVLPFESGDQVRYFASDHYRSALDEGYYDRIIGLSWELSYALQEKPMPFAELLMISESSAGIYTDLLQADSLSWGAGLVLSTSVSLIGLKAYTLRAYTGYDSLTDALVFGIILER